MKRLVQEMTRKTIYKTFEDMIVFEGVKNVIPDAKNIDEAEIVYYKFYSKEDEKVFGVVAIGLRVV